MIPAIVVLTITGADIAAHDRELREQIEQEVRADMFHGVRAWVERFSPGDRLDPQA